MNWGKGIVAGMALFMLFIIGLGITMFYAPADDYDHQYYERGLGYNYDYQLERRVIADHAQPLIAIANGIMHIQFSQPAKGVLRMLRPSDQHRDLHYNIDSGKNTTVGIPLNTGSKGNWQLVVKWQSGKQNYLYKQEIYIP